MMRRHGSVRIGLSGLAVAAAAASVVWVALPYISGPGSTEPTATQVVASAGDNAALGDYLDAHREIAGVNPVRQASFAVSRYCQRGSAAIGPHRSRSAEGRVGKEGVGP